MKLFFIPMIIVAIIVSVWLLFSWLARTSSQPEEMVADLERMDHGSWSQALNFANVLRDPRQKELRLNEPLATRLAGVLDHHLTEARMDKDHVWLRMYLCRALGEFEVTSGLPILIKAARQQKGVADIDVRRAAVQAIAVMGERADISAMVNSPSLVSTLRDISSLGDEPGGEESSVAKLRAAATFALGMLVDERVRDHLSLLLGDRQPNVRFNAAIGLSRQGDVRAVPALVRMLEADSAASVPGTSVKSDDLWKQEHVLLNAIRASIKLIKTNPSMDSTEIVDQIRSLENGPVSSAVRLAASEALLSLPENHGS